MLWIVGTSVSIESGGYAPRLSHRVADELGIECANLSIGDQTSLMGCMRVLDHRAQISPGDVVIWEYSLLDTLLVPDGFPLADVEQARRVAWDAVLKCKAWLVVVMTPPKQLLAKRSDIEARIASDSKALNIPCIDGREIFASLALPDAAAQYRDDRHPYIDSPFVDAMVGGIYAEVAARHGQVSTQAYLPANVSERPWRWIGATELADTSHNGVEEFRNSFMAIRAIRVSPGANIAIPGTGRIVGVGVVSTHESGGLWCNHSECSPVSTRLPRGLDHAFLLRSTTLPCRRANVTMLAAAPRWAYHRGVWAAYGQELSSAPGPIAVFGILYESGAAAKAEHANLRWLPYGRLARAWCRLHGLVARAWRRLRR